MFKQIFEQIRGIFCSKFSGKIEGIFGTDFRKTLGKILSKIKIEMHILRIFN